MNSLQQSYKKAKAENISDDDIYEYLSSDPEYSEKIKEAESQGISRGEILSYLGEEPKPKEPTTFEKGLSYANDALRIPMQALQGATQAAALPYEVATGGGAALYNMRLDVPDRSIPGLITSARGALGYEEKPRSKAKAPDLSIGGIFKGIGDLVGVDVTPKNTPEKVASLTSLLGQFGPGSKVIQEQVAKQASKFSSPEVASKIGDMASNLPLATAAVIAEEDFGVPEIVTFTAAAGARPLYEGLKFATTLAQNEFVKRVPALSRKYLLWDPAKMTKKEFDSLLKTNYEEATRIAKQNVEEGIFTQQEYDSIEPFLKTAYEYGIPVNPSAVSNSQYFRDIEKNILENNLTGESAAAFRQHASEQWADSYLKAIDSMSKNVAYQEQGGVVDALKSEVTTQLEKQLGSEASTAYDKSRELFKDAKPISNESMDAINKSLDKVQESLGKTLFPTSAQSSTKELAKEAQSRLTQTPSQAGKPYLEDLQFPVGNVETIMQGQSKKTIAERPGQKALMEAEARQKAGKEATAEEMRKAELMKQKLFGKEAENIVITPDGKLRFKRDITPDELVNSVKSLNSTISWDYPEIVNLMKTPRQTIKDILHKEYGATHKEALAQYEKGNQLYGKRADLFGKDGRFKKWGIAEDTLPEDLLKQLGTIDRFKAFEKEFGTTAQGKELIDHLKYLKVRDELNKGFTKIDYSPGGISQFIQNVQRNPMMKYLIPKEVDANLNKLKELDRFMFRRAGNFYKQNAGTKGNELLNSWLKTKPIVLVKEKGKQAIQDRLSTVYSQILLDPKVTSEYIRIGERMRKASESGSKRLMREAEAEAQSLWQSLWESAAIYAPEAVDKTIQDSKKLTKANLSTISNER